MTGAAPARRALVSVSDKSGLVPFVTGLARLSFEVLSTGGTAQALRAAGVAVKDVSEETGFPEIMDGRVKTLHPKIHGALLGRRDADEHVAAAARHGIRFIDLVVVNLYPFEATVAKEGVSLEEAIENIDIGGPSMIRSAAKNSASVAVVTDPSDYPRVLEELERGGGVLSGATRAELARKAFETTAAYDAAIAAYLAEVTPGAAPFPARLTLSGSKVADLRYGENPHQRAAFYRSGRRAPGPCVAWAETLSGKELSYNNLLDLEAAFELAKDLAAARGPAAAIVKHTNPCGAAVADTLAEAFDRAYEGDPLSAFGGILAVSRSMDLATAERVVAKNRFFEAVIAPDYSAEALRALAERSGWGKDLRVLKAGARGAAPADADVARLRGGFLVQDRDAVTPAEVAEATVATRRAPTDDERRDLAIAWIASRHVKSNAIVLARGDRVVGVGAGQMSRVDATEAAIKKAGERSRGSVLASDAFFPFRDGVDAAALAGVAAIAQPGGSKRDPEVIAAADEHGIAMVFTGRRHFRHGS